MERSPARLGRLRDAELLLDLFLAEPPRVPLQHGSTLLQRHVDLVADGDEALGEVLVVTHHEPDGDHEIVDVVEDERVLSAVGLLVLEKVHGMLPPVPERV